jgi:hypothetical protein
MRSVLWIVSYLSDRTQHIAIGSTQSNSLQLNYGVPQGSVLGLRKYCMFCKPIDEICSRHGMNYHCYVDDTQVYLVIKPRDIWNDITQKLESCLSDISRWMKLNLLKLNQDKTELIIFAPQHRLQEFTGCQLEFYRSLVNDACCVKNLGVFFVKP